MIINIISNALKFTKEGGKVTVFATTEDGKAAIHVEDTGRYCTRALTPYFEKFRQGDGSLKRRRSGTGLGLALVKTLAELQQGVFLYKAR